MAHRTEDTGHDSDPYLQQAIAILQAALPRLADDVGVQAEAEVVRALAWLKLLDMPTFLRWRQDCKSANRACSLSTLDAQVDAWLHNSAAQLRLDDAGTSVAPVGAVDADCVSLSDAQAAGTQAEATRRRAPGPSTLQALMAIAQRQCQLHHDSDRQAVAVIDMADHSEVWPVQSPGFEAWLRAAYWQQHHAGVPEATLRTALATLTAAGINDGCEVPLHTRVAHIPAAHASVAVPNPNQASAGGPTGDTYLIDLCDARWRVVQVNAAGWSVLERSPVLFTRSSAQRPLPVPEHGGALGLLWEHINIPPAQRSMVLTWLLECLRPETPFAVLELVGEQGSAKSTTQSVLRSLIDPSKVMLRARPKTVEDIFVAAANNWLVSYENISSLSAEQQDALCTLATGGGFATRELYSNQRESLLQTKRPVVMNGIAVVATRPDLIDRVIHIDLPSIAAEQRRDDAQTTAGWLRVQGQVWGALLDLFVSALRILPQVQLAHKQRMADFERLGEAVARALGQSEGAFQQQYARMVQAGVERALEGNAVAQVLEKFLAERILPWQGTAGQLYATLNDRLLLDHGIDRSSWPRSPKGLADQLRRIAPAYRARGVDIRHLGHSRDGAQWRIAPQPQPG